MKIVITLHTLHEMKSSSCVRQRQSQRLNAPASGRLQDGIYVGYVGFSGFSNKLRFRKLDIPIGVFLKNGANPTDPT